MKIKENDVFRFSYNEEQIEKMGGQWFAQHCFDGQLIAKEWDGKLHLKDTYWSFGNAGNDGIKFGIGEAKKLGKLIFICNLNDIEKIDKNQLEYYDDKDLINLSYQHGCYEFFAKRKGAKRSIDKMRSTINDRITKAKREIESAIREIENLTETRAKLESGDLTVHI